MEYQIWYCGNCGQDREHDQSGRCPNCGNSELTTQGGFTDQVITLDDFGLAIIYGQQRPWQEQWHTVKNCFDRVKEHYKPGDFKRHIEVWRDVMDFHAQCYILGDWLWRDPATDLKDSDVKPYMFGNEALEICDGVANTLKHHTRDSPKKMTATVYSVSHNNATDAARARIDWSKGQDSGSVDALELAERCMAAWEEFFRAHNLSYVRYFI